jgi:hypothetical protein
MQRAEKNIEGILEELNRTFRRIRQESIDEELFDVISGYEALSGEEIARAGLAGKARHQSAQSLHRRETEGRDTATRRLEHVNRKAQP